MEKARTKNSENIDQDFKVEQPPQQMRSGGRICRHWYKGHCWLESTCGFQHPPRETLPPNLEFENNHKNSPNHESREQSKRQHAQRAQAAAYGDGTSPPPYQGPGRVCHHWERGYCWLGNTCGFLHPVGVRSMNQVPQGFNSPYGQQMNHGQPQIVQFNPAYHHTRGPPMAQPQQQRPQQQYLHNQQQFNAIVSSPKRAQQQQQLRENREHVQQMREQQQHARQQNNNSHNANNNNNNNNNNNYQNERDSMNNSNTNNQQDQNSY